MQSKTFNIDTTRQQLLETLAQKQANSKQKADDQPMQKPVKVKRAAMV
jgi:hypothetical protein